MKVQTPILRLIVHIFGNISLQLHEYSFQTGAGLLNLLQNILLNCLLLYSISGVDLFEGAEMQQTFSQSKPLFGLYFKIFAFNSVIGLLLIKAVHCLFYGARLIALLDSEPLKRIYLNRANYTVIYRILFIYFIFIGIVACMVNYQIEGMSGAKGVFRQITIILIGILSLATSNFPVFILHYVLYGTRENLREITQKLTNRALPNLEIVCIERFKALSNLNRQFFECFSTQLLAYYLFTSLQGLTSIYSACFLSNTVVPLIVLAFPLMNIFSLVYFVGMNRNILEIAEKITVSLRNRSDLRTFRNLRNLRVNSRVNPKYTCLVSSYEMDAYLSNFQIKLFNLITLDRPFLLATCFFLLNYLVFIYQTK